MAEWRNCQKAIEWRSGGMVMEWWNSVIAEWWNGEWQNGGMAGGMAEWAEWWDGGMAEMPYGYRWVEWRNGNGMAEWWNGGMVECRT